MNDYSYLIVYRDSLLRLRGVNSGAEMATLSLARFLAKAGKRVVVCAELDGPEISEDGVEFWDIGADYDVSSAITRARALGNYHLISAGRALPIILSKDEVACKSKILITHDRAGNDTGIQPKVLNRIVDAVVCVSEAQRQVFAQSGADPKKLHVIRNGVDRTIFTAQGAQTRDSQKLVFVGALVPDKGLHVLIEAFANLKARWSGLTLDVYGSADLWGREKYLDEAKLSAQVPGLVFHGAQNQRIVAEAFRRSALCITPSIWFDPFPLTALEAQACGCPVVAFDVGGLKEGIADGVSGLVVKDLTAEALTNAIHGLLEQPEKLKAFSVAAVAHIEQYFTWERVAREIISLCQISAHDSSPKANSTRVPELTSSKIGVVTTWNQQCGLATYAQYLLSAFPKGSFVVLAEDTPDADIKRDQVFVDRCWNRRSNDFSALERAIERNGIKLLHLNFHDHHFIPRVEFLDTVRRLRAKGVKVLSHFHTTYSASDECKRFLEAIDGAVVHSVHNQAELIAQGAASERVKVLPHGVFVRSAIDEEARRELKARYKLPTTEKIIVAAGFIQPSKGMEGLIATVAGAQARGIPTRGYIIGKVNTQHPAAQSYYQQLKNLAQEAGVSDRIEFIERFLGDEELHDHFALADLVVMNYQSQYYEASGACSLAIGAGAVVATSLSPVFDTFQNAVWRYTSGFSATESAAVLLQNQNLRKYLTENAKRYADEHAWPNIVTKLENIYAQFGVALSKEMEKESVVEQKKQDAAHSRKQGALRVLVQNRPNTFTQRGGDTVVLEHLVEGLKARGVSVSVDMEAREDPAGYDLVHLFNFALPDFTRTLAQRAHNAGVPYVVTTLYEDVASFHNQSHATAALLMEYRARDQDKAWYMSNKARIHGVTPSEKFDNLWTAQHAAALFTNGAKESTTLRRDYPGIVQLIEVPFGHEVGPEGRADLFFKEYGVKDFVLCVGRIESRKNQLMLLRALEDSDIPVVIAGSGFSYQPEYEQAVRSFKRKGQTLVLGRLSPEMLSSAYAAAKVHALPSWYELPGLVSLEAAHHGCNVVMCNSGTSPDYFGSYAFYCEPNDEHSILNAVLAAYYSPVKPELKTLADGFTWQKTAELTYQAYQRIVGKQTSLATAVEVTNAPAATVSMGYDMAPSITEFQEILEKGEIAARNKEFTKGHELLGKAEKLNSQSVRVYRTRGAIFLAESNIALAKEYFTKALSVDAKDARSLSGFGMCLMMEQKYEQAYPNFVQALEVESDQLTALMQLVDCSYRLERFEELERALRVYVRDHGDDLEMKYCLAGCLYKQEKLVESEEIAKNVAARNPTHSGAKQLLDLLAKKKSIAPKIEPPPIAPKSPSLSFNLGTIPGLNNLVNSAPKIVVPTLSFSASTATTQATPLSLPTAITSAGFDETDRLLMDVEEAKRNREDEALKKGIQALQSRSSFTAAQREQFECLKAEVEVLEGNLETAQRCYDQLLQLNPRCARAICGKGALAAHANDWLGAEKRFKDAQLIKPDYDVALAGLGLCAWWNKRNDEAWSYYLQALKVNPENARALLGIIQLGYPLNRLAEVEKAIQEYLELHPLDLEFLYSLAGCYFAQNKLREAEEEVRKIIMFEPKHERAVELQGMIVKKHAAGNVAQAARA